MHRLVFEKTGNAIWISHLDLMRLFQRAFKRAGLPLKHTQGFNPRPSVSIALPLSVGIESHCELLDFELDGVEVTGEEIVARLNQSLVEGVRVLSCADSGRKIRDLSLLSCTLCLEYDNGVPAEAGEKIVQFLTNGPVVVPKKTKSNGIQDQDIAPMIRDLQIVDTTAQTVVLQATICCQNPTLNPMQMYAAVERYLPEYKADFVKCARQEIFDDNNVVFR